MFLIHTGVVDEAAVVSSFCFCIVSGAITSGIFLILSVGFSAVFKLSAICLVTVINEDIAGSHISIGVSLFYCFEFRTTVQTSIATLIIVRSTGTTSRTFIIQILERPEVDLLGLIITIFTKTHSAIDSMRLIH